MPRIQVPFPVAGRSDGRAYGAQPLLTTRSARNVRVRDPKTGRMRGASRAGLTKYNAIALGAGRVKALCSTAIDSRKVEYGFTAGAETSLWHATTSSKAACLDGKVDRQGNVYALDGNAGILKLNSAGAEVMKVVLPVLDVGHIVRALTVDGTDRIFAAVSEGGDWHTARMWCVLQLPENQYQILWQIEPGAYTEELRVQRGSQLYAAHNYPEEKRARVLIYESLGIDPRETGRIEDGVVYPIHGMDVLDGAVYTTSRPLGLHEDTDPFNARPGAPGSGGTGDGQSYHQQLVGWTPKNLTDADKRIWSWYDSEEIDETDVEDAELVEGQQILRWRDRSGNGRHFYAGSALVSTESGPRYTPHGLCGRPSVRFTNRVDGSVTTRQSLVTLGNPSIDPTAAQQQRTAVPTYVGAQFCLFMVLRPSIDGTNPRAVLAQENEHATASDHVLYVNRDCQAAPPPGVVTAGMVSYFATTDNTGDAGRCAGPTPQSLGYDFTPHSTIDQAMTGALIVTILWDGGVDPNDTAASRTRCIVRYNGAPLERFEGLPLESLQPTWLGACPTTIEATGMDVARRLNGEIAEMICLVRKDIVGTTEPKVLSFDALEDTSGAANQTDTEMAQIEAYLAYRWGVGTLLAGESDTHPHFYGYRTDSAVALVLPGPPKPVVGGLFAAHRRILFEDAVVTKHDTQGVLQWAMNSAFDESSSANRGGVGFGVRARKIGETTHVWVTGEDGFFAGDVAARKLIDKGASFSLASADGAWRHRMDGNYELTYAFPRMAADAFGNLFLPADGSGAGVLTLHVLKPDPDGSGNAVQLTEFLLPASAQQAFGVALPPDALNPEYRGDLTDEVAEFCYLFTSAGETPTFYSVHKVRLVSTAALTTGSPHEIVSLGIVEDDIKTFTNAAITVPTGGSAAIDGNAQYIACLRAGDSIVVVDGTRYLAYSLRDGTVATLASTSAGEIPPRAQLAMFWRHRLVLGRFADRPGGYAASKLGDIRNWDFFPSVPTATQAFKGSLTRAGEAEDALVAMIPASDDLAFLLGDSKILRLTGDPQDGGNLHLVTDSVGGTFGDSWCKDDEGRIYMFGNPPGLYALRMPEGPLPLSEHTLAHSEFAEIDYSTHRIVLAWDPTERAVRIFQVAWGTSEVVNHWAYEVDRHELARRPPVWTDRIYRDTMQPTAVAYLGGDDSRTLLIGCADGYVRKVDPDALTDDGDPIDSLFVSGPLNPDGMEWRLTETEVTLAADQGGARIELFSSEVADEIGNVQHSRDLHPGLNRPFRKRVKGEKLFLRVRNAAAQRWALESIWCEMEPCGHQKQVRT